MHTVCSAVSKCKVFGFCQILLLLMYDFIYQRWFEKRKKEENTVFAPLTSHFIAQLLETITNSEWPNVSFLSILGGFWCAFGVVMLRAFLLRDALIICWFDHILCRLTPPVPEAAKRPQNHQRASSMFVSSTTECLVPQSEGTGRGN